MERYLYFVAVKLLVRDENKLLITHDIFGDWDLPGGRIRKEEFDAPLEQVIDRKMTEEIGTDFKYEIGDPIVSFRVERLEQSINKEVRIFAVGYTATYLGGEVQLGDHHDVYEWIDVDSFEPEKYFTGGWLAGVQDYLAKQRRKDG